MSAKYWFARRFPVDSPRKAIAPVSWEGYAVSIAFVVGMILSAAAYGVFVSLGDSTLGVAAFAIGAAASAAGFVITARRTADMTRTVADYKAGRAPGAPEQT